MITELKGGQEDGVEVTIDLVFITYNRLDYTKLALTSVLADPTEKFSLAIWDNASTDDTVDYLKHEVSDPRIADIIFSKENLGQANVMNKIWSKSKADLLGKLDNDCLVTSGWTRTLAQAHNDIDNLGVIACWHYFPEDFDYERAKHKIRKFGRHQILRHPWTCGTGFLLKRSTYEKFGPIGRDGATRYWLKIARAGYVNGFYYPLVYQEHMDDPLSKHTLLKNDDAIRQARDITYWLRSRNIDTVAERMQWRKLVLANLLDDPWEPKFYVGLRKRLRQVTSMASRVLSRICRKDQERFFPLNKYENTAK